MAESPYDRFHVDVTISGIAASDPWDVARFVWDGALDDVRGHDQQHLLQIESNLWVSGANEFDVKRGSFDELKRACEHTVDEVGFMFFNAQIYGLDGLTGLTLFFRPAERFLSLSVRGNARFMVDRLGRLLYKRFADSRRLARVTASVANVKIEPMGVSTTDSLKGLLARNESPSSRTDATTARTQKASVQSSADQPPSSGQNETLELPSPPLPPVELAGYEEDIRGGSGLTHSAVVTLATSLLRLVRAPAEPSVTLALDPQLDAPKALSLGKAIRSSTLNIAMLVVAGVLVAVIVALLGINFLPHLLGPTKSGSTSTHSR